jgi:hypothetical protein
VAGRSPAATKEADAIARGGRCHLYVFPRTWEDHCKLGFSRNPLSRLQALHHRWFEFFDLDQGALVETETVRDARDLELRLRRQLVEYNAPAPLTVRAQAAGHSEWYRGASALLDQEVGALQTHGHAVHAPLRPWLRAALADRGALLYDWTLAQLAPEALEAPDAGDPLQCLVRDALDAYVALDVGLSALLPPAVVRWHRAISG